MMNEKSLEQHGTVGNAGRQAVHVNALVGHNNLKMEKRTVDYCREYYGVPDNFTDEDIVKRLYGSFGHRDGDMHFAIEDFKVALFNSLPGWYKRLLKRMPNAENQALTR